MMFIDEFCAALYFIVLAGYFYLDERWWMNAMGEVFVAPFVLSYTLRQYLHYSPTCESTGTSTSLSTTTSTTTTAGILPRWLSILFEEVALPGGPNSLTSTWVILHGIFLVCCLAVFPFDFVKLFVLIFCFQWGLCKHPGFFWKLGMYSKPFVRFGETFIVATLKISYNLGFRWAGLDRPYHYFIIGADCVIHVLQLCQQWSNVKQIYYDKFSAEENTADAIVLEKTRRVIEFDTELFCVFGHGDSSVLPEKYRTALARMMREKIPYCVKFLTDYSGTVLDDTEYIKQMTERRTRKPAKGFPLYKQWQRLELVKSTLTEVLALKSEAGEDGRTRAWVVTGPMRNEMENKLKNILKRDSHFAKLIQMVLGARHGHDDQVAALVDVDRRIAGGQASQSSQRQPSGRSVLALGNSVEQPAIALHDRDRFEDVRQPGAEGLPDEVRQTPLALQAPPPEDHTSTGGEQDSAEEQVECICCFDRPAVVVFRACGHLAYCKTCRKKALKNIVGSKNFLLESYARLLKKRLPCPLCRTESSTCDRDKYTSHVFVP